MGQLLVVIGLYIAFLAWARLLPTAGRLLWRLRWVLLILFVVDWWLISLELAVLVSLRVILLSGAFAILFATTTPEEFRLALEWLRLPYRYAFSLSLAVQSIALLEDEWRAVMEAQRARGAWAPLSGWRNLTRQARDLVALAVPAAVMTTRRAWAMTESAYARGFDSPFRRPYRHLRMGWPDWALLAGFIAVASALALWP
jgi:energy-coupling factor transport system permease protein